MRLRKTNDTKPPAPRPAPGSAPKAATPAAPRRSRRFYLALAVLVLVVGAAGWGAWSLWKPDPLRDVHAALDRRDFHAADELLAKRVADHPDDDAARLLAVRSARRAGNLARASDLLRVYEQKRRADPAAEFEARLLLVQSGNVAEANRLFAEYAPRPNEPDTALAMEAYLEGKLRSVAPRGGGQSDGDAEEAAMAAVEASEADLRRAVDLWLAVRPGRADQVQGRLWRARVLMAANKHPGGVAALREAVDLDPANLEARYQLALAVSMADPPEACRHLEVLRAQYPANDYVAFGLANTYRSLGRLSEARALFEGLSGGPTQVSALVELARLDLDEGKIDAAERRLRKALELAPNGPETIITMSRCQHLAGRPDEAEKYRKRFDEIEAARKKPRPPAGPKP